LPPHLLISQCGYTAEELLADAEMLGYNCTAALLFNDTHDAEGVLKALQAITPISFACVYRKDGSLLAQYKRPDLPDIEAPPLPQLEGYAFEKGWLGLNKRIILNPIPIIVEFSVDI